jgi:hypothetical protein
MRFISRLISGAGVITGLMLGATQCGAWVVVPPRAGQVGLGIQGQYGMMLESGSLGTTFGSGPGLTVRLRYRMRYERGLGLSFESQSFDARELLPTPMERDTAPDRVRLFTAGPEVYQMFGTRTRTHKMLSVGAGLAKVAVKLGDGETVFPVAGDGVYVSAGAGIEQFFWQSWAYDLSTRYMAVFHDRKPNHDFQISLGLIFYASY